MTVYHDRHQRRQLRLENYDYTQAGAYFVTICTRERACLLGEIVDGKMQANATGQCVHEQWLTLPQRFRSVTLDSFVVMPNHVHGIVCIGSGGALGVVAQRPEDLHAGSGAMNRAPTLGKIVRTFKAVSTRTIRQMGNSEFAWQRNYYEHIIRDDASLRGIREYIANNPLQWALDRENPACSGSGESCV